MDLRSPRKGEAMRKEELRRRRNKTVSYKTVSDVRVFERRNAHTQNIQIWVGLVMQTVIRAEYEKRWEQAGRWSENRPDDWDGTGQEGGFRCTSLCTVSMFGTLFSFTH